MSRHELAMAQGKAHIAPKMHLTELEEWYTQLVLQYKDAESEGGSSIPATWARALVQ
jgi:hypothetical protein